MNHDESQDGIFSSPATNNEQHLLGGQPLSPSLHPRLAWMMYYEETKNVQAVAEKFGISRKTFYKWYKRYKEAQGDSGSLKDRSKRPHRCPRATPESSIRLLKLVKEETGFGQRRLRTYLEAKYHVRMSERTIWKILKQHGANSKDAAA
ncbi:MAG: helix-turn-helix domain-containing protein [Bacteroidota bacterium]